MAKGHALNFGTCSQFAQPINYSICYLQPPNTIAAFNSQITKIMRATSPDQISSRKSKTSSRSFLAGLLSETLCDSFSAIDLWCLQEEENEAMDSRDNAVPKKYLLPNDQLKFPKNGKEAGNTDSESVSIDKENDEIRPLSKQAERIQLCSHQSSVQTRKLYSNHKRKNSSMRGKGGFAIQVDQNEPVYFGKDDDSISTLTNVFSKPKSRKSWNREDSADLNNLLGPFEASKTAPSYEKNENAPVKSILRNGQKPFEASKTAPSYEKNESAPVKSILRNGQKPGLARNLSALEFTPIEVFEADLELANKVMEHADHSNEKYSHQPRKTYHEAGETEEIVREKKKKSRRKQAIKKVKSLFSGKRNKKSVKKTTDPKDTDSDDSSFSDEEHNNGKDTKKAMHGSFSAVDQERGNVYSNQLDFPDMGSNDGSNENLAVVAVKALSKEEKEALSDSEPVLYSTQMHFAQNQSKSDRPEERLAVPRFQDRAKTHQLVMEELNSLLDESASQPEYRQEIESKDAIPQSETGMDSKQMDSNHDSEQRDCSFPGHSDVHQQTLEDLHSLLAASPGKDQLHNTETVSKDSSDMEVSMYEFRRGQRSLLKKESSDVREDRPKYQLSALSKSEDHNKRTRYYMEEAEKPSNTHLLKNIPINRNQETITRALGAQNVLLSWFDGDVIMNIFDWIGRRRNFQFTPAELMDDASCSTIAANTLGPSVFSDPSVFSGLNTLGDASTFVGASTIGETSTYQSFE